jgi:hypothetical protein
MIGGSRASRNGTTWPIGVGSCNWPHLAPITLRALSGLARHCPTPRGVPFGGTTWGPSNFAFVRHCGPSRPSHRTQAGQSGVRPPAAERESLTNASTDPAVGQEHMVDPLPGSLPVASSRHCAQERLSLMRLEQVCGRCQSGDPISVCSNRARRRSRWHRT